jgi:uroporphyrinogen-III synthase
MSLRVAITRASPGAEETARRVRAMGAAPVLAPLLIIEPRAFDADVRGAQALLFTSAHGVRAFAAASRVRDCVVLTVGDASADAARVAGFTQVHSANGEGSALATLSKRRLDPEQGALLHFSGANVAGNLVGALEAAGFRAERRIVYHAQAVEALPPALAGPLDLVLFHSPRAAEIFLRFGAPGAAALIAACLSPAVAAAAGAAPWRNLIVAPAPREDALLEAAFASFGAPGGANA